MQAKVTWLNDVTFVGESGSGHALVMDGSPDAGGRNIGIRPMEAVLIGMGGCAAFDVVTILKKSRAAVRQCWVELRAQRATTYPGLHPYQHAFRRPRVGDERQSGRTGGEFVGEKILLRYGHDRKDRRYRRQL